MRKALNIGIEICRSFLSAKMQDKEQQKCYLHEVPLQPYSLLSQRTLGLVVISCETRNDPKQKGVVR